MLVAILLFVVGASAFLLTRLDSGTEAARALEPARPSGPILADFSLPDLAGSSVRFNAFAAARPAVVSFGTTSCPYCRVQLEELKKLRQHAGDKVAILEIHVGEAPARAAEHAARMRSPFTTLVDQQGAIYSRYGTGSVPLTIVTDGQGRILEQGGVIPAARITELLKLR